MNFKGVNEASSGSQGGAGVEEFVGVSQKPEAGSQNSEVEESGRKAEDEVVNPFSEGSNNVFGGKPPWDTSVSIEDFDGNKTVVGGRKPEGEGEQAGMSEVPRGQASPQPQGAEAKPSGQEVPPKSNVVPLPPVLPVQGQGQVQQPQQQPQQMQQQVPEQYREPTEEEIYNYELTESYNFHKNNMGHLSKTMEPEDFEMMVVGSAKRDAEMKRQSRYQMQDMREEIYYQSHPDRAVIDGLVQMSRGVVNPQAAEFFVGMIKREQANQSRGMANAQGQQEATRRKNELSRLKKQGAFVESGARQNVSPSADLSLAQKQMAKKLNIREADWKRWSKPRV